MPPYDCMLLFKPNVKKEALIGLVARIGKHVCRRNGVVTEVKSFRSVQLGYGVKKLDGRFYQGQLMQVSMMATPEINKELHYLNKEDKLLRWLLVKQRNTKFGLEFMGDEGRFQPNRFSAINRPDDEDSDTDGDDDEYEVNEEETKVN
ncbi:Translation elongation factor EF1B/ribosomal protein S6 family protein [Trifolium repens]|nr:Translation elongation factor EF1B/ribosomal protein S6 family protein [Trifolium repens]